MKAEPLKGVSDSYASWALAIAALREMMVRCGQYAPVNETERRWAAEGPREASQLDTVR